MNTEEGNELIAEFMNGEFDERELVFNGQQYKNLKYHSSWDWLMPVVEKIHSLQDDIMKIGVGIAPVRNLFTLYITATIDVVWLAVVEFIKWYSQNKQ
jgi:hypothetical protein